MPESEIALPNNRFDAIKKLFDAADYHKTEERMNSELPLFQVYLNYALTNLQEIATVQVLPPEMFDPDKVEAALNKKEAEAVLPKLADFLWLFNVDKPKEDFGKDYKRITIALVKRLYMLRSFFCHPTRTQNGIEELIVDHDFYQFFGGWCHHAILQNAFSGNVKTSKVFEMKLLNPQNIDESKVHSKNTYAFTRKGIILLICMALYKDDATEFCQGMHDMKLMTRELEEELDSESAEVTELKKKSSSRRALHQAFTYFSMRRSYGKVNQENHDFICFADILAYLNKVPIPSLDFLALHSERDMLAKLEEASTESETNKFYQYALHRRMKDRFLSFLVGYCEDFNIMPSIHFKRLDISETIGRKRYRFGKENDNSVRQSRHYDIKDEAVRFEYRPKAHIEGIHIRALRSSISASELQRLVVANATGLINADMVLESYFAAYHRVLEGMLNAPDGDYIDRTPFLKDLETVTGATTEQLSSKNEADFIGVMTPYFPENLTRFFIPKNNIPSEGELRSRLQRALQAELAKSKELAERLERLEAARQNPPDAPKGRSRERRPSDGCLISQVFKLINLYLPNEKKFRQLPRGKQHRACLDFEYQTLHAIIGRFGKDSQALWDYLKGVRSIYCYEGKKKRRVGEEPLIDSKRREELIPVAEMLRTNEGNLFRSQPVRYDIMGKQLRTPHSLSMLARAAIQCYSKWYKDKLNHLNSLSSEELQATCRRLDIRVGMPLCREALLKSILHLDKGLWEQAYKYADNRPWMADERKLENAEGHVVTQVPLTNSFAQTCLHREYVAQNARLLRGYKAFLTEKGEFDFNRYFREEMPKKQQVQLRNYYDTKPLVNFLKTQSSVDTAWQPELLAALKREMPVPTKNEVEKAIREIKTIRNQDYLLLSIAQKYHNNFISDEQAANLKPLNFQEKTSVFEYFNSVETIQLNKIFNVTLRPNDRLRYVFTQLNDYAKELQEMLTDAQQVESLCEDLKNRKAFAELERVLAAIRQKTPIDFYDLSVVFRFIQTRTKRIRQAYMPKILELERLVDEPILPKDMPKEQVWKTYYDLYLPRVHGRPNERARKVPFESFKDLMLFRNQIFHKSLFISQAKCQLADKVLKRFGIGVEPRN